MEDSLSEDIEPARVAAGGGGGGGGRSSSSKSSSSITGGKPVTLQRNHAQPS